MSKNIAVIGAGVAGLAFAILATQRGHQVKIFERNQTISTLGAGVTLWPNAMFVLDQMEQLTKCQNAGGLPLTVSQFDQHSRAKVLLNIDELNKACGYPSVAILRKDLMRILYQRAKKLGIQIHFGDDIKVTQINHLMTQYDLVVGADGRMRSATRNALFGNRVKPRYQGFINIIGVSHVENLASTDIREYRGERQRFGIVPVKPNLCYWAAAWCEPKSSMKNSRDWHAELRLRFDAWPNEIRHAIVNRQSLNVTPLFVHDLDPLPHWHCDNLLLLGDAAHAPLPTSGQGACQALEDAWHLATTLDHASPLGEALDSFFQKRIAKTTAAQVAGRHIATQVFADEGAFPNTPIPDIKQLSEFWMQGLVSPTQ
ncbi:FAD-dependent monooxygenase [Pseudoalteromonas sp. SMS1]|uniref:FAD-dependent monooxygenase n=1 Tax=Pseudoalteromonas sp. SMS1 TaxID=2908894 RepID=UPI002E1C1584